MTQDPSILPAARALFCIENLSSQRVTQGEPWSPTAQRGAAMPPGLDKSGYQKWCADPATRSLFFSGYEGANAGAARERRQPGRSSCTRWSPTTTPRCAPAEIEAFLSRASPGLPAEPGILHILGQRAGRVVFRGAAAGLRQEDPEGVARAAEKGTQAQAAAAGARRGGAGTPVAILPLRRRLAGHPRRVCCRSTCSRHGRSRRRRRPTGAPTANAIPTRPRGRGGGAACSPAAGPGRSRMAPAARGSGTKPPTIPARPSSGRSGMQCFTGPKPFVTWSEILGKKFTDEFRAATIGAAINGTWFDGRDYWLQVGGVWRLFQARPTSRSTCGSPIRSPTNGGRVPRHRRSTSRSNKSTSHACVDGAAPFVFRRDRPDHLRRQAVSQHRPLAHRRTDGRAGTEWGDGFPWIADFLAGLFDPDEQLDFFLSWLAYAYRHAHAGQAAQRPGDLFRR